MSDFVSVIIPTYNRPFEVLKKALISVQQQTHENLEIIIVDDSPSGNPYRKQINSEISEINDGRIKYIQHSINSGACVARNTGIKHAGGDYIAFLDDDDEWLPRKVELQLKKFTDEDIGLVYCDSFTIKIEGIKEVSKIKRSKRVEPWAYEELILENKIGSTSFVMIKRRVIQECGLFNEDFKSAQDADYWLRISRKFKVSYVDIPLVNYFMHEGERITTNIDNKIQGLEMLIYENMDYLNRHPKAMSIRKLKVIDYYNINHGLLDSLKKWLEAVKVYPLSYQGFKTLMKILYNNLLIRNKH